MSISPGEVPRDELGDEARSRLGWDIWTRVFRFRLMPPRPLLQRLILERDALGTQLWDAVMRPALEARVPAMFAAAADPAMRRTAMDLRRVGASAYALAGSLYYLHGTRPDAARTVGVAAMWLAQAAAVMDYLLDEEGLDPAVLAAHVHAGALAAALPWPGDSDRAVHRFDAPPFEPALTFVLTALEQCFAGLRACLAQAPDDAYHRRLHGEISTCLQEMAHAELGSAWLALDSSGDLDEVERTLRRVNTLSVRLFAYAGLLVEPAPAPGLFDAVARMASLAGDIGWTLDALEDVIPDLAHGVWNRAWLLLAGARYRERPDEWQALVASPARALETLAESDVIDDLLASIEAGVDEIAGHAAFPASARQQLVDLCRLWVWSFLAPRASR